MKTHDLNSYDSSIRVFTDGNGWGRPTLLVTGFIGVASFWQPILAALSKDRPITLYDQRGTGASGRFGNPLTMDQMIDDGAMVLESIDQPSVHLVGHSAGAGVVMALAARCPSKVASVTLICGWTRADLWMRRVFLARLDSLNAKGAVGYLETTSLFMRPSADFHDCEDELRQQEQKALLHFPGRAAIQARTRAVLEWDSSRYSSQISCPTLILGTADDNMTPFHFSEKLAAEIPGSTLVCLKIGGHYCVQTRSKETVDPILKFLTACDLAAAQEPL